MLSFGLSEPEIIECDCGQWQLKETRYFLLYRIIYLDLSSAYNAYFDAQDETAYP